MLIELLLLLLLLFKIKYLILVIQSKKTDYNTKISEIQNNITTGHDHDKSITTQEFNKLTSENFTARLKQASLANRNDIVNFVKMTDFENKLKNVRSNKNNLNKNEQND